MTATKAPSTVSFSSGEWWIETSAENVAFLMYPAAVNANLTGRGKDVIPGKVRIIQLGPYQWPHQDSYSMALLVKLNMCDEATVCPLSAASLASALSDGTFPFDDPAARAKVSANLDDYVRFLMGLQPLRANRAMPLDRLQTGEHISDYASVSGSVRDSFQIDHTNFPAQLRLEGSGTSRRLVIRAAIEMEGVYPLEVTAAPVANRAGLPAMLRVEPGVEVWYRIDGGELERHDGQRELVLGPIHSEMGVSAIRMVAVGRKGGEVFQAELRVVDLQGTWLVYPKRLVRDGITCTSSEPGTEEKMPQDVLPSVLLWTGALGSYRAGNDPSALTWEVDPKRVTKPPADQTATLAGSISIGTHSIQLKNGWTLAPKTGALHMGQLDGPWPVAALALAPPLAVVRWRRGRRWPGLAALAILMALAAGLLSGCVGGFGSLSSEATLLRPRYVGAETIPTVKYELVQRETHGDPLWVITGTATYQADLTLFYQRPQLFGGMPTTVTTVCRGALDYEVEARIYKDVTVPPQT